MKTTALSLVLIALVLGTAELMGRSYFPIKPLFPVYFPEHEDCVGRPPCKWRPDHIHPAPGERISWPAEFRPGGRLK